MPIGFKNLRLLSSHLESTRGMAGRLHTGCYSRHIVIQDKQTGFAAPDRRQLGHFSRERPFAAIYCILNLFRCDMRKEFRRQVGVEIHGR